MLTFLQANWGTAVAALAVAFVVFLAVNRMIQDKKAGIGICGQKCSQCPKMGHCEDEKASVSVHETSLESCKGVCANCPHSAQCHHC